MRNDPDFKKCLEETDDYHKILLDLDIVEQMIRVISPMIKRTSDFRQARDQALRAYRFADSTEEEGAAYKDFLNRYFNKKAVAGAKRKHRPRTPVEVYEDH
jgi:type III secretory pathway component EscR